MDTSTLPTSTSDTVSVYVGEESPGGAVIFTGPDGVGDHRMTHRMTAEDQLFVGHTTASPEATGDVRYLIRAPETYPTPAPRCTRVGEVGWGVPRYTDHSLLKTGYQIQLKEFRRANEERYTHRYQSPYYLPHRDSTSLPQRDSDHSQQPPVITDNAQSLLGIQSSTLATQPRTDTASSGMNSSISLTSQNA